MPPQQGYLPQPVPQQHEEAVRVIATDDGDYVDRDFYYYRDGEVAVMTAWLL